MLLNWIGLKYAFRIRCDSYELNPITGEPISLQCTILKDEDQVLFMIEEKMYI